MAINISETTGEEYYSGKADDVNKLLGVVDIGEGKLDTLTGTTVNYYQEIVDREIDDILSEIYHVPLKAMNRVQPDGETRRVFPGSVRRLALYWTAGMVLLNEFQQLADNVTDQATQYIEEARRGVFALTYPNHKLPGQELKSNLSRTLPPSLQPPGLPEANF